MPDEQDDGDGLSGPLLDAVSDWPGPARVGLIVAIYLTIGLVAGLGLSLVGFRNSPGGHAIGAVIFPALFLAIAIPVALVNFGGSVLLRWHRWRQDYPILAAGLPFVAGLAGGLLISSWGAAG
jgi:hypothetical protein